MGKNVRVILSSDATEVYKHLNEEAEHSKIDNSILNAINNKIELIKANFHYGYTLSLKILFRKNTRKSMVLLTYSGWSFRVSGACFTL